MTISKDGKIIILSSPSGAGKTTLVKKISKKENFKISISHTTREPRSHEVNGKDYFFISKDEFKELIKADEFLEHAEVFGNYYGSTKQNVLINLNNGENVLFDIDWQGTIQIKNRIKQYEIISFFILPPSKEELYSRLINRGDKEKSNISKRMEQFNQDILHWKDYDFVVVNDELEKCSKEITNLIYRKIKYDKKLINKHIDKLL